MQQPEVIAIGLAIITILVTIWIALRAGQLDRPKVSVAMLFERVNGTPIKATFLSIEDIGVSQYEVAIPFTVSNIGKGALTDVRVQCAIPMQRGDETVLRALFKEPTWSGFNVHLAGNALIVDCEVGTLGPDQGRILAFVLDYTGDDLRTNGHSPHHLIEDTLTFSVAASNHRVIAREFKVYAGTRLFCPDSCENLYDYVKTKKNGVALRRHPEFAVLVGDGPDLAYDVFIETGSWGTRKPI